MIVVPAPVHALRKQGDAVVAVAMHEIIVINLKRSLRICGGLGEGRAKRTPPKAPFVPNLGRPALERLIRGICGKRYGDVVVSTLVRDMYTGRFKFKVRGAHITPCSSCPQRCGQKS